MSLADYIFPLLTSYFIVLITVSLIRKYALRWKLGNKPNGRKIHASSIPHLGGIGITFAVLGSVLLYRGAFSGLQVSIGKLLPGMSLIIVLGLFDDVKNLKALHKLVIQLLAAVLLVLAGVHLSAGPILGGAAPVLTFIISIFFITGVANSMNLIDGHDGLASGICMISASALAVLAALSGADGTLILSLVLASSCLSFLMFNFPPGRIFMGDTGSMFLGIMLAVITCSISADWSSPHWLAAVVFILGVPALDTSLAICRRIVMRVPIFKADCLHVHHVLVSGGYSDRQTLLILYALQIVMSVLGILVMLGFLFSLILGVSLFLFAFVFFLKLMISSKRSTGTMTAGIARKPFPALDKIAK